MVIGVDLGGMSAKAAVLSNGKLYGKSRIETSAEEPAANTALAIVDLCKQVAEKAGVPFEEIKAIGIGSPGVIESATGVVVNWTNFGWENVPLAALIQKITKIRTFITNDANAAALGEAKYGAGKKYEDSVLVTIGTGVGGGIIIGGKLFEGYRSAGTEIGHMVIERGGKQCSCGRKGCYEMYASARALISLTQEAMLKNPKSALWKYAASPDEVDGRTVFLAARENDEIAQSVIQEFVEALGEGILNIVNILRPQAVMLGGGVSAEKETLLAPLRKFVYSKLYVSEKYAPLDIVCAELGNEAGLYGAAQFAIDRM